MSKDQFCFLCVLATVLSVFFIFVYLQWELVTDPRLFLGLTTVLLVLSFWTSATEAAYSVAVNLGVPPGLKSKIQQESERLKTVVTSDDYLKHPEKLDVSTLRSLVQRSLTFTTESRDSFVGAFAAASVFLNSALVAFVPLALTADAATSTRLKASLSSIAPGFAGYLHGPKWLTFASTTFTLLVLGKIVPKMVGFAVPYLFTYRLAWGADVVHLLFGWLARGIKFPLQGVLSVSEEDRRRFGA